MRGFSPPNAFGAGASSGEMGRDCTSDNATEGRGGPDEDETTKMLTPVPPDLDRSWIAALPKAEVHLHLEGCIPEQLGDGRSGPNPIGAITTLAELLSHLDRACATIERANQLGELALALGQRAAKTATRHLDVIVNPSHWRHWHNRLDAMVDALDGGFTEAEQDGGPTVGLCVSLSRSSRASEAEELVDRILALAHPRVVGLSIDGNEAAGSHNERFAAAFTRGDIDGVVALLTEDAWYTMPPVTLEYQGRSAIAEFLRESRRWRGRNGYRLIPTRANGQPAYGCYVQDAYAPVCRAHGLMVLTLEGGQISAITRFVDNSILTRFGLPRTLPTAPRTAPGR